MKRNIIALMAMIVLCLTTSQVQSGRGGAFAGGFFAGALTGGLLANAADDGSSYAYYDTPVYDAYYPETTGWGAWDYPAYSYYPVYAYSVDTPAYVYPRGYVWAY